MNAKEALTFSEFLKEFNTVQYKYLGLYGMDNKPIVRFNGTKTPLKDKIEEIKRRLDSRALGNGFYRALCKNQTGGNVECDEYIIRKGTPAGNPENYTMINSREKNASPEILTYKNALELETKIIRLETENDHLIRDKERLEDEIAAAQEKIQELEMDNDVLSDDNKEPSFLSQFKEIAQSFMPILEEHFEIEKADRELQAAQLRTQRQWSGLDPLQDGTYFNQNQKLREPQQQQQHQQPGEPARYENLSQEQLEQFSPQQQKQLWEDYCNRLRTADPQAYNKLMNDIQKENVNG